MAISWEGSALALFNTGIAFHKRVLRLKAGQTVNVSLPVKQEHLDNMIRSLRVKGDGVRWSTSTFEAEDARPGALQIDATDVTGSLAVGLSGARVSVDKANGSKVTGVLLGLDTRPYGKDGAERRYLTVRTRQGITSVALDEITDYRFSDKIVRSQIERALSTNRKKIQPGETSFDFELTADKDTTATVYFTQPSPVWKLTYRLSENDDHSFSLEAFGVADNKTPEDWELDVFSLVNGNPIHFGTNIDQVFQPQRQQISVVPKKAAGRVDHGEVDAYAAGAESMRAMPKGGGRGARHLLGAAPAMAGFAADDMPAGLVSNEGGSAFDPQTSTSAVGDLRIYTSGNVSILSGKSGLIPLFREDIADAKAVLFSNPAKHGEHPWRAIKFSAPSDLGKGPISVTLLSQSLGDMFGGEEILEACTAGDERLAVHQEETGVNIKLEHGNVETRRISIELSAGILKSDIRRTTATKYSVTNKTDTAFTLVLDHSRRLHGSVAKIDGGATIEDLKDGGARVTVEVKAKGKTEFSVTERKLDGERLEVGTNPIYLTNWLRQNVLAVENPLSENEALKKCFAIQTAIDETNTKHAEEVNRVAELQGEVNELRANLQASGENAPHRGQWLTELEDARQAIKKSQKETQPQIKKDLARLQKELVAALKALSASWKDE